VDVTQRNMRRFIVRDVDTQDTRHGRNAPLTLTLFMAWIAADHVELPMTPHELAVFANTLHAGSYFHSPLPCRFLWRNNRGNYYCSSTSGANKREKAQNEEPDDPGSPTVSARRDAALPGNAIAPGAA